MADPSGEKSAVLTDGFRQHRCQEWRSEEPEPPTIDDDPQSRLTRESRLSSNPEPSCLKNCRSLFRNHSPTRI